MSTCRATRLEEIRGDFLKKELRALEDGGGSGRCRGRKSTDLADSAEHDDEEREGTGEKSRMVGIKSLPNIACPIAVVES